MSSSHIPSGLTSVTPYLIVRGASQLIDFMKQSFDAVEISRQEQPGRGVMHSQIAIDGAGIEVSDATNEIEERRGTLHLYVQDVDAAYRRAISNGAKSLYEPTDQVYGDREAGIEDPLGNYWFLATHVRDVSPEKITAAMNAQDSS